MKNLSVWAVHLLTASGAALSLVAAVAAGRGQWQLVFILLGIAMFIDGIDGPIARALGVSRRLPWFDGAILDLVVDYTTYVLIPALVLALSGLLSEPYATASGIVVTLVGALYFADTRMKTASQAFRGFPAVWNVIIFLLMVYKPPEPVTLFVILACAALTFAPLEFVHPMRVKQLRPLTFVMSFAWAVLAIAALASNLSPGPLVLIPLAVVSIYFAVVGAYLQYAPSRGR